MGVCELRMDGERAVLVLSGDFGISDAAGLKEALVQALSSHDSLDLDLGQVESMDLTFMQVLRAAHLTLARRGKELGCVGGVSPVVFAAADAAGFLLGSQDQLFWKRGV